MIGNTSRGDSPIIGESSRTGDKPSPSHGSTSATKTWSPTSRVMHAA